MTAQPDQNDLRQILYDPRGTGFVIFQIDTKKFDRFNIYQDEEFGYTDSKMKFVWTPTHIPPGALSIVDEFKQL